MDNDSSKKLPNGSSKKSLKGSLSVRRYRKSLSGVPDFSNSTYGIYPETNKTKPPLKEGLAYGSTLKRFLKMKKTIIKK